MTSINQERSRKGIGVALRLLLAFALTVLLVPTMSMMQPNAAFASDSVYMAKLGRIDYFGGVMTKHEVNGVPAICADPSMKSPPSGYYTKDYNWSSGVKDSFGLANALYYGPGGPGFDPDLWPTTWFDGSAMDINKYEVCQHLIIADRYHEDFETAIFGCSDAFREWAWKYIVSLDSLTDNSAPSSAAARQYVRAVNTHRPALKIFRLAGGDVQTMFTFDPQGKLVLKKASANPSISDGNNCYTLAGIQYAAYSDEACTNQVATFTSDKDGNTEEVELTAGTYYIKEIASSVTGTGYAVDPEIHEAIVTAGETNTFEVKDIPQNDPTYILVGKYDGELTYRGADSLPQGSASLEGAEFTVRYYSGYYDTAAAAEASGAPSRSWVFKTNKNGVILLQYAEQYLISGDPLYFNTSNQVTLPLGTVLIQETKAPTGYLLGNPEVFVRKIVANGTGMESVSTFNTPAQKESVKRGDLEFIKVVEGSMNRLAGVPFALTSETNGETHILVTDENGYVSTNSAWNAHSHKTNGNDKVEDGVYDDTCGTWFGSDEEGNTSAVNDKLGALPYDTYTLEELPCEQNAHYGLLKVPGITIKRQSTTVDLGTLADPVGQKPSLMTTAYDAADLDKYVMADSNACIQDAVQYMNLEPGEEYTLKATLAIVDTGEPLVDDQGNVYSGETSFTASDANGKTSVNIPFNAQMAQGSDIVVYERLYRNDIEIASHEDRTDVDQQVRILSPQISTTATDGSNGDKTIEAARESVVVDEVRYSNLVAGNTYTIEGALMLRDGADASPLTDADGKTVMQSVEFTPSDANGTIKVAFVVDTTRYENATKIVVFERLFSGERLLASHEDPTDEGQTVEVAYPTISTTATDAADGDKTVVADAQAVIDDAIAYEGLVAGQTYQVFGIVMDKATGLPLDTHVTAAEGDDDQARIDELRSLWSGISSTFEGEDAIGDPFDLDALNAALLAAPDITIDMAYAHTSFTPAASTGSAHATFSFDATKWIMAEDPIEAVVYEVLAKDGSVVATHADIEDTGQTVEVAPSRIGTEATDAADGDHTVLPSLDAKIIDTISYENLIPGREYTIIGKLMDKTTGQQLYVQDKPVEETITFVPNDTNGEVKVTFTLDTTHLLGKELVAFESVSKDGVEVAVHADINDGAQTVVIKEGPKGSLLPKTGSDWTPWLTLALIAAACIAFGCVEQRIRRSTKTNIISE